MKKIILLTLAALILIAGGVFYYLSRPDVARLPETALEGREPEFTPARKQILPTVMIAKPVGWADGAAPVAARGLVVQRFAAGLDHPRQMLRLPNGDILVAETNSPPRKAGGIQDWIMGKLIGFAGAGGVSANRITLLRDTNGDGIAEQRHVLLEGLNSPYGMALIDETLYVANTDSLMAFPYKLGETRISVEGRKVANLPANAPNNHWTRSLAASPDGKLYVGVGSNSNIAENGLDAEDYRAAILEIDPRKGEANIFASGLRNPTDLAWNPWTGSLWAVVNERDMLGSDLVPDYMTDVEFAAFYGWPWNYWGGYVDRRVQPQRDDLREYTRRPAFGLGTHTAPLGLAFTPGSALGAPFNQGAFVALHGSWNRKPPSGYKVSYVAFDDRGRPQGKLVDLLTGFLNKDGQAQGRPVDVLVAADGSVLVSDDVGGIIWRVSNSAKPAAAPTPERPPAS
ncbi:glucose/arabinose dehydrogenase [Sphingobium sp. B7D2B]|uniref:PQQ-dependent sugar dehydrogenase n=1 Tax=Sphingobium sp. B7D2B TaxID=2940583 RepID=UPI00222512C0|nr:sorbosone dehydrogenase family protein [Sphingobium sp. B7D2B]MCW2367183.1 glucose/arabinose dehydrogenase [Sphingobium sp. B7D2B]